MQRSRQTERRRSRHAGTIALSAGGIAEAALLAATFAGPLALGSIHPWSIGLLAALALSALLAVAFRVEPLWSAKNGFAAKAAGAALLGVVVVLALQCLPLPHGLLRLLSVNTEGTYDFALAGLPQAKSLHPLSLDPPSTARELCKAIAVAAGFLAALGLGTSRRRRRRGAAALALSGAAVALIGYGHKLLNAEHLFGLDLLPGATATLLTPFGNRNNAAGFLCLTAPVALGLALRERDRRAQLVWAAVYLATGAAVFLTLSRGGMVAFALGQVALALVLWRQRRPASPGPQGLEKGPETVEPPRPARRRAVILAACGALATFAAGTYLAAGDVSDRLASLGSAGELRTGGKLQGFVASLGMLRDFPLAGIGRGAFPTVGARYLPHPYQVAEYIEDEPLQLLVDLGLPIGFALLALLALALLSAARQPLTTLECGLWAGLFSLALANLVDFSVELAGVAVPAAIGLGLLLAPESAVSLAPVSPGGWRRRWLSPALVRAAVVFFAAVGAVALVASRRDWRHETDAFAKQAVGEAPEEAVAHAASLLSRHPASFVVPFAVGNRYLTLREPGLALPWLNRAMYFGPGYTAAHYSAAIALAELGRKDQALLEARLYTEAGGGSNALPLLFKLYPDVRDLEKAVPDSVEGLVGLAGFYAAKGRLQDALAVAADAVARDPGAAAAHQVRSELLLAAHETAQAVAQGELAVQLDPRDPGGHLALANALAIGDQAAATQALEMGLRQAGGSEQIVFALVRLDLAQRKPQRAEERLRFLRGGLSPAERARVFALEGDIETSEGRFGRAEDAYRNAARLRPGDGYQSLVARSLEQQSRYTAAAEALRELEARLEPEQRASVHQQIAADEARAAQLEASARQQLLLGGAAALQRDSGE